jgi:hypothetical protein
MSEGMKKLMKQRKELLAELCSLPIWIDGSIVETTRIQSGVEKPFSYLSRSKKGKNQITYISGKHLDVFTESRRSGESAKQLVGQIIEVSIQLLKLGEGDE